MTSDTHNKTNPAAPALTPHLADWSDEDLLSAYRGQGNRRAFAELVRRYERELYSYLRRYLGDASLAEDSFQATFLQLHLKCDLFEEGRKVKPWLYTIATNQAIDAQRRNRRHRMASLDRRGAGSQDDADLGALVEMLVSKEPTPTESVETDERRRWVQSTVAALPEPLRRAVQLVYYQGLKYREAAEVLDVPVGTVKSRLHTAILNLAESWRASQIATDDGKAS